MTKLIDISQLPAKMHHEWRNGDNLTGVVNGFNKCRDLVANLPEKVVDVEKIIEKIEAEIKSSFGVLASDLPTKAAARTAGQAVCDNISNCFINQERKKK